MLTRKTLKISASAVAIAAGCGLATNAVANDDTLANIAAGNVVQPNITYNGWNHSLFDQINTGNVADLTVAWTMQLGVLDQWEASPLVVGDMMYVVSPVNQSEGTGQAPNTVLAIDLNNQSIVWEFRPDVDNEAALQACCGDQTRGLQYAEGKIFFHTLDGQAFALDGATGEALWRSIGADVTIREHTAGNGIVIGDLYIIGNAGGEYGARGKVSAFDINDGQTQWVMYNMGPNNEVGIGPRFNPFYADDQIANPALDSWWGDSWRRGGGTVWGYFTADLDRDMFFYGTGNCGPWNPDYRREWGVLNLDENGGLGEFRNNYCASTMARDATTGELIWAYNITPADPWDIDEPLTHPLIDNLNGTDAVVLASRTGYFYSWNRDTGELLNEPWPFVYVNFMNGVDMDTGRPGYNYETWLFTFKEDRDRYTEGQIGVFGDDQLNDEEYVGTEVYTCPFIFARNWQNDTYSPQTGLLYTATITNCGGLQALEGEYVAGEGYILINFNPFGGDLYGGEGGFARETPPPPYVPTEADQVGYDGGLMANDPAAGETAWVVNFSNGNSNVPVFSTAGGLVFQGNEETGEMVAYDATNGDRLWAFRAGSDFNQSAVSYIGPDGRQYIAIIASSSNTGQVNFDDDAGDADRYRRAGTTLFTFALPTSVAGGM